MDTQLPIQQPIKAVIFDLGGVILRTEDPQPRSALAKRLDRTYAELDEIVFQNPISLLAERGLATPTEVWQEIARLVNLPDDEIPRFRSEFFGGDRVELNLIDLIQKLRERYRTALLSNTWFVDLPRYIREDLQIPDTFDFVISSAQAGVAKPDPAIFHLALQTAGVKPAEAVFVDDNKQNVQAASQLGIHAVRFMNASQMRHDISGFIEIPGTEHWS